MSDEKRDFDKDAATWDENPMRLQLAKDVAAAIRDEVPLTAQMDVLDFGCGTGLLTLQLQPFVRSVTGVDSSQGMLNVLEAKIARQHLTNARTRRLDLDEGDALEGGYHLIVSSMTLHHVRDIEPLLRRLHGACAPTGHLCLADLDSEGGRFHADSTGVFHSGFDRDALRKAFTAAEFQDVRDRTAATVTKPAADGVVQPFTVFLISGRKNA